ncbi:hypothetical protein [Methanobrevibacter olleyae]|uniref:Uncharacterized protein n=1 Tax=Methanobrevibacter olleyae TaxID=294671 RepID=A0A126R2M7_METOL|nr:hypothetical protein [Methanobrevibacter olleyae]AMK16296.1 hypothetical protein YLM1_1741 [Methanobrevibacter olleyae]
MELLKVLENYKDDLLFCDRTGRIISIYFKDEIKVIRDCGSVEAATRKYRKYREVLERGGTL